MLTFKDLHARLGTQDIEQLDNMMDGQSHRVRLNATVRNDGTVLGYGAPGNYTPTASNTRRGATSRGGRGGGIIGTRSRGGVTPPRQFVKPSAS